MTESTGILQYVLDGFRLLLAYWWAWLTPLLAIAAYQSWFEFKRTEFLSGLKWALLELIPPPEIPYSSPKAAESIFAGLHATYAGVPGTTWKAQFFQGKVPIWFSLELVSNGGETHFYIRCQEQQRNLVESLVFAQYPEAELRVVPEDYVNLVPFPFDPERFDVFGAELELIQPHPYPIKSYIEFEEAGGKDEHQRLDPLAPLLETMSALRPGEHLWVQFLVRATGGEWVKEGAKVVEKLMGKPEKKPEPPFEFAFEAVDTLLGTAGEPKKEEKQEFSLQKLTPAQKRVLEQVEYKLAKLAFKTGIRVFYIAGKESFDGSRVPSVIAMFKQLYYNNLNSFKPGVSTKDKGILKKFFPTDIGFFAKSRALKKKKKMLASYRLRAYPRKEGKEMYAILNTEELATLWHLPGMNVRAPLVPRVQAKKGQPPTTLPTRQMTNVE